MKKQMVFLSGIILSGLLLFSACSAPSNKTDHAGSLENSAVVSASPEKNLENLPISYASDAIMYSNLTDATSRKEVFDILQNYDITKEQTDTLARWADDFNKRVHTPLPHGFQKMTGPEVDYSTISFDQKEAKDGSLLPEANCRLTSFLLMKNFIHTNGKKDKSDTYLIFDLEAADTSEQFKMNKDNRSDYYSLYNWVPVDKLTTLEQHTEAIQRAWKDRDIQIDSPKEISMINVYIHSVFEDVRIVGHTGMLLDLGDKLLFVEKYGPAAPFQAIWFHNRTELKKYLLARQDLYGDEEELAPVIMENGHIMKTE